MKKLSILLALVCILACSTSSFAAFTAGMGAQAKNDAVNFGLASKNVKFALGLQSANTTVNTNTAAFSSFTEITAAHGYTAGGLAVYPLALTYTSGATSPITAPAANMSCAAGANFVWTATDSTGITADCGVLYDPASGHIYGLYTWTSATASGNGATLTITQPTISNTTRGMLYFQ